MVFYIINSEREYFSYFENNIPVFSYYPDDCPLFTDEAQANYYSKLIDSLGYKNEVVRM